jgi:hypothetical protein
LPMSSFLPAFAHCARNRSSNLAAGSSGSPRGVQTHQMERHVVLLRSEHREVQWLFRIAMVPGRIPAVRYEIRNHAVGDPFLITGIQTLQDDVAHRAEG